MSGRDILRDAERDEHQRLTLHYHGTSKYVGDPYRAADILAPPPMKRRADAADRRDLVLCVDDADDTGTLVWRTDPLSETLGIRPTAPVPLDTTALRDESRREVYNFVARMGETAEVHDKTGREKVEVWQAQANLARAKARWWTKEAKQTRLRRVKQKVLEIQRNVRGRAHRAAKAKAEEEAAAARREAAFQEQCERARTILAAVGMNDKWRGLEEKQAARQASQRRILAHLETATEVAPPSMELRRRQRQGRSNLLAEWDSSGVPLTAAAAAHTFGTQPYTEPDVSSDIQVCVRREAVLNILTTISGVFEIGDLKYAEGGGGLGGMRSVIL